MSTITRKVTIENLLKQRETIISRFGEAYVPAKLNEEIRQLQTVPAYEKLVNEIINDLKLDKIFDAEADMTMTTAHISESNVYVRFQIRENGISVCFAYNDYPWIRGITMVKNLSENAAVTAEFSKFGFEVEAEVAYLKDKIGNKLSEYLSKH